MPDPAGPKAKTQDDSPWVIANLVTIPLGTVSATPGPQGTGSRGGSLE